MKNYKRTERIYNSMGLQLGKRRRGKKLSKVVRIPRPKATRPNEVWSMDFVFDVTSCGRRLKLLNVVDDFTKKCIAIVVSRSIRGTDIAELFDSIAVKPARLRCDNGPEFQSTAMITWAEKAGVEIEFIEPGKPIQNAYIESFNSRIRDECLNEHIFFTVEDARVKIAEWIEHYHSVRPHSSLGMQTPNEFAANYSA